MKNSRIIMADPELNYIIKLQIKFLQELQDSCEIDVITDKKYFDECFSSPQNADCLIINNNWESNILTKHNIDHVVILTDGTTGDLETESVRTRIPRYTSTEEIFNQIRSILGTESSQGKKKEATVVYFGSASGGTGKTVLSMCLAEYLSRKFYRVLYINTQSVQTFQFFLNDRSPIPTEAAMALLDESADVFKVLRKQIREERFSYLPPFAMPLFSYGISNDIYTPFVGSAKESKEFDYIIIDAGSDLTNDAADQIALSDKVVMVTKPEKENSFALKHMLNKISVKDEKLIRLCNRVSGTPVRAVFGSDSLDISESISEWEKEIDAESIHSFSLTDDIQKMAVLIG